MSAIGPVWSGILFALFLWWFSTGLIILADRLPQISRRFLLGVTSVLAVIAIVVVFDSRDTATVSGAFMAFAAALVLWGWHEVSFLTGLVTGPRRSPCPPGAKGLKRFRYATETLIHHEIAIALTVVALAIVAADSANPVAFWTFTLLWVMRLSAKFNIFLGVPKVTVEFLPARLDYLKTYFGTRRLNPLYPFSVTFGILLAAWLSHGAMAADADPFSQTAYALIATLTALAVLEHWFMVLPIRDAALWQWYLGREARPDADHPPFAGRDLVPDPVAVTTPVPRQSKPGRS